MTPTSEQLDGLDLTADVTETEVADAVQRIIYSGARGRIGKTAARRIARTVAAAWTVVRDECARPAEPVQTPDHDDLVRTVREVRDELESRNERNEALPWARRAILANVLAGALARHSQPERPVQVGDVLTTQAQLDACPVGTTLRMLSGRRWSVEQLDPGKWYTSGVVAEIDHRGLISDGGSRVLDLGATS